MQLAPSHSLRRKLGQSVRVLLERNISKTNKNLTPLTPIIKLVSPNLETFNLSHTLVWCYPFCLPLILQPAKFFDYVNQLPIIKYVSHLFSDKMCDIMLANNCDYPSLSLSFVGENIALCFYNIASSFILCSLFPNSTCLFITISDLTTNT